MSTTPNTITLEISDRTLTVETGHLAGQADGSVTIRYGDTVVLVTACIGAPRQEERDFLPLTVDFEERLYAAGKIPGSFFRREGRPGQEATLAMRLTDRSIRPLFPKGFTREVQIVATVLSADQENDPDILLICGASAALGMSSIPFEGPVSAVRVGYASGKFIINPTFSQRANSHLDLVVAGTTDAVIMVEAGANEVSEEIILEAIKIGQEVNAKINGAMESFLRTQGKQKIEFDPVLQDETLARKVEEAAAAVFPDGPAGLDRVVRNVKLAEAKEQLKAELGEAYSDFQIGNALDTWLKKQVRRVVLEKGIRVSGRGLKEIRPISCEVGLLPRTHGSGLFTRGETQVLTITTLGSLRQEQMIDSISPEETKRYLHHYNFPPYSTGEVKRLGTGRREIGHGALAERALVPVIPDEPAFPYTIRLVSEVVSSNGSTSMASVCGSTLSLMDAGVPIKAPVAGVAMGLITDESGKAAVLTDIEGIEDFFGDMDFKVAGTEEGITALQMDLKIRGISYELLKTGLEQAREGRLFILERMNETISSSRPELSRYAPKMIRMKIDPDKIRDVIGPGGRMIKSITQETGSSIDIQADGTVTIGAPDNASAQRAIAIVEGITKDPAVGDVYTGKVQAITDFGAFVEILPGKDGLVHISELENYRVASVEDVVSLGDEVTVQVIGIDPSGKIKLSRKALLGGSSEQPQQDRQPPRQSGGGPPPRKPFAKKHGPRR